jgi:hypothetical protein
VTGGGRARVATGRGRARVRRGRAQGSARWGVITRRSSQRHHCGGEEGGQGDKEDEGSEEAVEGKGGEVLEGGEGADDDEYEKATHSPSAEDHDDGDSSLTDIDYLLN